MGELSAHVSYYVSSGSFDVSSSLGFASMPEGYALMLNSDRTHHYWINSDGVESSIDWDKWQVYRNAKAHKSGCRR